MMFIFIYIYIIDERTNLTAHRSTMKKSKKSPPSFSELPDNPDFALLRTINVRNTSSLLVTPTRHATARIYNMNQLIQHLFNDDTNVQQPWWQTCMQECVTRHIYTQTTTSSKELHLSIGFSGFSEH